METCKHKQLIMQVLQLTSVDTLFFFLFQTSDATLVIFKMSVQSRSVATSDVFVSCFHRRILTAKNKQMMVSVPELLRCL